MSPQRRTFLVCVIASCEVNNFVQFSSNKLVSKLAFPQRRVGLSRQRGGGIVLKLTISSIIINARVNKLDERYYAAVIIRSFVGVMESCARRLGHDSEANWRNKSSLNASAGNGLLNR